MSLSGEFTINGETGLQDADSLPTATLVINGNDNVATVTITKKATGRYKWSVTPPTASEGDHRQVIRFATVDGMTDARSVFEDFVRATSGDVSGGDTIIVTPIQASVTNPRHTTRNLGEIPEGTAPADIWVVVDGAGDPIDLSGKTLRFVVASVVDETENTDPFDDVLSAEWKYETDGDGITVGGDNNNQVTVQHDADKTVAGDYRYFLYNVTDGVMLAKGRMAVTPAVLDVVA